MTSPSPGAPAGERPAGLSPAYTAAWELFADWCTTTGHAPVPATSSTLLTFLHDCPAAPATQALRVRAITTAHTRAGHPAPPRTPAILEVLRGRARRPDPRIPLPPGHVDLLLADLPIHGWTNGWFGRRDRALLVLADTRLTYRAIACLAIGDVTFTPAGVAVNTGVGVVELPTGADSTICRPCALAHWIDALQFAARTATVRIARAIEETTPLTPHSPHRCQQPVRITGSAVPLLTASNSWGHLDAQPTPLTPRTMSRLARADQHRQHRRHPPGQLPPPTPPPSQPPPGPRLKPIDPAAAARRRHATAAALAPLTDVLDHLDSAAADLERRTADLMTQFKLG